MDENIADIMKMDGPIERFIEKFANSFIKWEIVQFYYEHPNKAFSIDEISDVLNRSQKELKKELFELKEAGFINEEKNGTTLTFIFCPGDTPEGLQLKNTLEQFISVCHEREGRLRVVYKLLKNGKPIQG